MEKINKIGIGNAKPLPKDASPVYAEDFDRVAQSLNSVIDINPSKRYHVFLSQAGTNAPSAIILTDSITPTLAYSAVGTYTVTKTGAFIENKTTPNASGAIGYDLLGNKITAEWTSVDVITIKTYAVADTTVLANDVLSGIDFNIEIFA